MRRFATHVAVDEPFPYRGPELAPHAIRGLFGVEGDALAIFRGPCEVRTSDMVDIEDQEAAAFIRSADMLHLLVEAFEAGLSEMVLLQRLFVARTGELVREMSGRDLTRRGDDLFCDGRKLSVSIATVSMVSGLLHLGLNIDPTGAPVPAIGLTELGVAVGPFAERLAAALAAEAEGVWTARTKVHGVLPRHGGGGSA